MPVDAGIRLDRATKLAEQLAAVSSEMESIVPEEARRVEHVYKKEPKNLSGLRSRGVDRLVRCCSVCGQLNPPKNHFRAFKRPTQKRPQNPCSEGRAVEAMAPGVEYYRLAPFTPSRDQLIRYQRALGRTIPLTRDNKTAQMKPSMDEKAIKGLISKYPDDKLYSLVLDYRELDKLAGTYIGRPV